MKKMRLPSNVSVVATADFPFANQPPESWKDFYVLFDSEKKTEYLVNETIRYFLDKFSVPKTKKEVFKEIANDMKVSEDEIAHTCNSFFRFLCKRKILIDQCAIEERTERNFLLKQEDVLNSLTIKNLIANKKHVDVYLAESQDHTSQYIIKLLNRNKFRNANHFEEEVEDFQTEYNLLKKSKNNPYIPKVYEFIRNGDMVFITSEYIAGESLGKFIASNEISEGVQLYLIEQLLQAFALLHQSGIIHGDIHPSNIIISADNTLKIIDLGLSIDTSINMNQIVSYGGVNFYMPPERITIRSFGKYSREPDFYSDVYQIGLMIYFILYNKTPFTGYTWEELAVNIKKGIQEYPATSCLNMPVNSEMINLLEKCLSVRSYKRFPNAIKILEKFKTPYSKVAADLKQY